ncbi:dipeptide ABC transporter ATP-binding protein [Cellulomonas fimi]|uniref:ABC transporter related protein n=1 Tax=Cellulomonas fimi (strain ATCC 484 / DSM 20113 / JCM 1341 / CCUG 24087 / LMG 16345 / NBRC 15513 / NCIMB 8980 / NCTC 7547 / NRS-133) TaxID=590998 RepID=F4GYY6_CELFA|nr:ABC transporter related protein [Cellulomonas fimi ATCC 484]VEH31170.1 Glutathione import ATP-binding protein GsiA [Cellulomonas fimi]
MSGVTSGLFGGEPLLQVRDLEVTFTTDAGQSKALRGVSLDIHPGETVAVVGESGSGKSTTAAAVIGLLATNGKVTGGQILFGGQDVVRMSAAEVARLRGAQIGLVPQDPMSNLNPVRRVGPQIVEALEDNGVAKGRDAQARTVELLEEAGLPDAARRAQQFPHEFSGGMRQRALIAMGLSARPRLLVADEPTSALDVTVQRTILDGLTSLTSRLGVAVLLITHDLGLAAERADTVVVMYRGEVVEKGPARQILRDPQHEYTKRLIAAAPSLASRRIAIAKQTGDADLVADDLLAPSHGEGAPPPASTSDRPQEPAAAEAAQDAGQGVDTIVEVEHVSKVFQLRGKGLFSRATDFTAVDDVSFVVPRGRTVALVGESGSGKSTVARMMLGLTEPTSGTIRFDGVDVSSGRDRAAEVTFRRRVQPIFQDPYASLDPLFTIYRTIEEPLRAHRMGTAAERRDRVHRLMEDVALPTELLRRYPGELSGGQRQRVAIARALALEPELVVCDEAVSALDVVVQAQILHLLADLQSRLGLSYLFISHDLAVVRQIADVVCVMEQGRLVEQGTADEVFDTPRTQYTRTLLDAIPGRTLELGVAG